MNEVRQQAMEIVHILLQEAPRDIPAVSFGMDDPVRQARFVAKLQRDRRATVIDQFGNLALTKAGQTIFIRDRKGLVYFVKWIDCKYSVLPGRHCIQIAVWRRLGSPPGIARHVLWKHLFPIHGTLMTDAKQTAKGSQFWGDRIAEALEKGFYIYRVNLVQKKRNRISTMDEYRQWHEQV